MATEPLVLAFDCSAAHCAAALLKGDQVLCERLEEMNRGQAERLMPLLEELLFDCAQSWQDLDAIGVGVGPGNFTGIRIAVSAARGLALGLNRPAVGVSGLEARQKPGVLPAVPAPRDQVYIEMPGEAPRLTSCAEAEECARGAALAFAPVASPVDLARRIAELTRDRYQKTSSPPAPLYLRAADAAPARDLPPKLLDD
ncbi:protease, putative [Roseobacter sp. SK209-2-6]|uniref:tRNA (adenosine(37)-N6)-threonylcarbamoyltransferase complex dimerization subunit type 1 TsaB n=1 Tax=Roseobacter sp. SK209-2-6 TaxID=388739 RepID=UPI0000F3D0B2|nr:tRNA (adenosine(37)-N6)-threonylcarbamoyltransferase complex dimerization subunit type 1 TsaB [Roseobacter sp. SK209-2-6]EBA14997.1 protease, putative [Roseobacter sp. SK209-2-6]